MKQFSIYLLCVGLLFLAACGGSKKDDPKPNKPDSGVATPDEVAKTTDALIGTWKFSSVTKKPDNVKEENLKAFTLTFAKPDAFTSQGAEGLFSAAGKWEFVKNSKTMINLDQKASVGIMEISEPTTKMTIKFKSPSEPQNARTQGLDGDYELVLEKQ